MSNKTDRTDNTCKTTGYTTGGATGHPIRPASCPLSRVVCGSIGGSCSGPVSDSADYDADIGCPSACPVTDNAPAIPAIRDYPPPAPDTICGRLQNLLTSLACSRETLNFVEFAILPVKAGECSGMPDSPPDSLDALLAGCEEEAARLRRVANTLEELVGKA